MELKSTSTAKFGEHLLICVKLSTFSSEPSGSRSTAAAPTSPCHQREHLLCLNQQEALMLFGLLQAALRHEPSRQTLLSYGDYKQFHRDLSQALATGLASDAELKAAQK